MARAQGDLKSEDISNFFADSIVVAKRQNEKGRHRRKAMSMAAVVERMVAVERNVMLLLERLQPK